jgi:hypothetical protein
MPQVATWVTASRHGGLWTAGPHLGAFDLETARTVTVVSLPRNELVVCAAWSADGSLLAAAGTRGSISLWRHDGKLVAQHIGNGAPSDCGPDDFHFATRAQRVLWSASQGRGALLGPGQALEVVGGQATLTEDGSRALIVDDARTTLLDGGSGKALLSIEGPNGRPALSGDQRFAAVATQAARVHVHDLSSGALLGSVPGDSAAFHGERLLVHVSEKEHEFGTTIAYGLLPLAELWRAPGVSVLDEEESGGDSDDVAAWGVGISQRRGYSVIDLRTGRALASWRASGYACGYQWLWQRGTLVFAEGDLLTFWSKRSGARTVHADCDTPRLNRDRSAVLVANGLWNLEKRTRFGPTDIPEGGVYAFGRAARVLHGDFTSGKELEPLVHEWRELTQGETSR